MKREPEPRRLTPEEIEQRKEELEKLYTVLTRLDNEWRFPPCIRGEDPGQRLALAVVERHEAIGRELRELEAKRDYLLMEIETGICDAPRHMRPQRSNDHE